MHLSLKIHGQKMHIFKAQKPNAHILQNLRNKKLIFFSLFFRWNIVLSNTTFKSSITKYKVVINPKKRRKKKKKSDSRYEPIKTSF